MFVPTWLIIVLLFILFYSIFSRARRVRFLEENQMNFQHRLYEISSAISLLQEHIKIIGKRLHIDDLYEDNIDKEEDV